jgi:hypothetical protein
LFDDRIERVAARALDTKKMPLSPVTFGFAIVAHNIHNPLQIGGHGMFRNIPSAGFPGGRHTLLTDNCLFTDRATVVKPREFPETMGVNRVSARQVLRRLTRGEHVLTADGTVVLVLVLEALVGIKDTDRNAHATLVAVAKGFDASNAAKPTLNAMKGLFGLRAQEKKMERNRVLEWNVVMCVMAETVRQFDAFRLAEIVP